MLISIVCLEAGVCRGVGVGDGPTSVSGCSCGSFVSRDGWGRWLGDEWLMSVETGC